MNNSCTSGSSSVTFSGGTFPLMVDRGVFCFDPSLIGDMAGVQLYNISPIQTQLQALYAEGLGGAPISNAGLVGWWPLDDNANDYLGNNNNGVSTV